MRVDMRVRVESGTPSPRQIERAQRCAATTDEGLPRSRFSTGGVPRPARGTRSIDRGASWRTPRGIKHGRCRTTARGPSRGAGRGGVYGELPLTHQPPPSAATDRGGRDRGRKMLLTRRGLDMRDLHGGPCRVRPCARKAFDEGAAASRLGWLEHGYSVLALRQEDLV